MFLNKQKIYLVIFLGFFISLITSSNYLNSYDKYSSKYNSHLMIKESIGGDWNKAQEIKEKKNLSWFNSVDYYKPYLPSRIIYFYYKINGNEIFDEDGRLFTEDEDKKSFILYFQTCLYFFLLFLLTKKLNQLNLDVKLIFFWILFLSLDPTINQFHSSFFNESLFFSLQLLILIFFFKKDKKFIDYILIGFFFGILGLQKSVGIFYIIIFLIYLIFSKKKYFLKYCFIAFIPYLIIYFLIAYGNYERTKNFFFNPMQTKEALFVYLLPKIYESKYKSENINFRDKIINETNLWIKKNNLNGELQENLYLDKDNISEIEWIKIHNYQQRKTFDVIKNNLFITSKILIPKYFHSLLLNPVEIKFFYKYKNLDEYYKSNDHQYFIKYRIIYSFIFYSFSLLGLIILLKHKKFDLKIFFLLASAFYFYLILGWMGLTRYFVPTLIYISFFFSMGLSHLLNKTIGTEKLRKII